MGYNFPSRFAQAFTSVPWFPVKTTSTCCITILPKDFPEIGGNNLPIAVRRREWINRNKSRWLGPLSLRIKGYTMFKSKPSFSRTTIMGVWMNDYNTLLTLSTGLSYVLSLGFTTRTLQFASTEHEYKPVMFPRYHKDNVLFPVI